MAKIKLLTPEQRHDAGKALREKCPRSESQAPRTMRGYAKLCGLTLAQAHDTAGGAAMIAGYLGGTDSFDEAMGDYAVAYADQVERDYATFTKAVRNGRLKADLNPSRLETMLR